MKDQPLYWPPSRHYIVKLHAGVKDDALARNDDNEAKPWQTGFRTYGYSGW
jgi:hypothetical protein